MNMKAKNMLCTVFHLDYKQESDSTILLTWEYKARPYFLKVYTIIGRKMQIKFLNLFDLVIRRFFIFTYISSLF